MRQDSNDQFLGKFFEANQRQLMQLAQQLVGTRLQRWLDAEDLYQETYFRMARFKTDDEWSCQPPVEIRLVFKMFARRIAVDAARQQRVRHQHAPAVGAYQQVWREAVEHLPEIHADELELLYLRCLEWLTPAEREVIERLYLAYHCGDDADPDVIARQLGISRAAFDMRLSRARRVLREQFPDVCP